MQNLLWFKVQSRQSLVAILGSALTGQSGRCLGSCGAGDRTQVVHMQHMHSAHRIMSPAPEHNHKATHNDTLTGQPPVAFQGCHGNTRGNSMHESVPLSSEAEMPYN